MKKAGRKAPIKTNASVLGVLRRVADLSEDLAKD